VLELGKEYGLETSGDTSLRWPIRGDCGDGSGRFQREISVLWCILWSEERRGKGEEGEGTL
jgi:hypothetical protein